MLSHLFHAWERRLAAATTDRIVRPFEWGLEWLGANGPSPSASSLTVLREWTERAMRDTDEFFAIPDTCGYQFAATRELEGSTGETGTLTFPSAFETPHPDNNTVYARYFPARTRPRGRRREHRRAVVVLPQWNADAEGHVGLCRVLAWYGMSALRLSLPYHDRRMPPELERADYIVSANIARTLQVCRQAVLDARRAIRWLAEQGYERIGILGTSLGSCLSLLTTAHEPLIRAQALNHISPFFADVVWEGLSTAHMRQALDGRIDLDQLRELWRPISPYWYLDRVRHRKTLLVYARYDLTFPTALSRALVDAFQARDISYELAVLPCGHYTTGIAPFKYLDGWVLVRFLETNL